jgi:thymidylate kinase
MTSILRRTEERTDSSETRSPPHGDTNTSPRRPRRSFAVALIGADGAGKTTVARRVSSRLSFRSSYIYMGSNMEAGNWMLPSTWLIRQWRRWRGTSTDGGGPPKRSRVRSKTGLARGVLRAGKSSLSMAHRVSEQGFRHLVAWTMCLAGRVVVFDRHYYTDYYAFDIDSDADRSWLQRLHGFILQRIFSKPDLVIFLDAPSEVLFARKGEGTIELLEHRRQDYLKVAGEFEHFDTVDATQTIDDVTEEVAHRIADFRQHGC